MSYCMIDLLVILIAYIFFMYLLYRIEVWNSFRLAKKYELDYSKKILTVKGWVLKSVTHYSDSKKRNKSNKQHETVHRNKDY